MALTGENVVGRMQQLFGATYRTQWLPYGADDESMMTPVRNLRFHLGITENATYPRFRF